MDQRENKHEQAPDVELNAPEQQDAELLDEIAASREIAETQAAITAQADQDEPNPPEV